MDPRHSNTHRPLPCMPRPLPPPTELEELSEVGVGAQGRVCGRPVQVALQGGPATLDKLALTTGRVRTTAGRVSRVAAAASAAAATTDLYLGGAWTQRWLVLNREDAVVENSNVERTTVLVLPVLGCKRY